jgi:type VI secretion system secreted protein Hcp
MAYQYLMNIQGKKQGTIKGPSHGNKSHGWTPCLAFSYGVEEPLDPSKGGVLAGKRTHKPVVITKEIDAASPLLYQMCLTSEALDEIVFEVFESTGKGRSQTIVERITLTNATITKFTTYSAGGKPVHKVSFGFENIVFDKSSYLGKWIKRG